jgi:hypothetical protein
MLRGSSDVDRHAEHRFPEILSDSGLPIRALLRHQPANSYITGGPRELK